MSYRIRNRETGEIMHSGLSYYEADVFREKCCNSDQYLIEDDIVTEEIHARVELSDVDENGNAHMSDIRVEMSANRAAQLLRIEKAAKELAENAYNFVEAVVLNGPNGHTAEYRNRRKNMLVESMSEYRKAAKS